MKLYTVRYKEVGRFNRWKTLKNVKGDGFVNPTKSPSTINDGMRYFVLEDETYIAIPTTNIIFKFEKDRWLSILDTMETEAGQKIPLDKR